jgi:hypothetical protein
MATKTVLTLAEKATAIEDAAKRNQAAVSFALAGKFPSPLVVPPGEEPPPSLIDPVPPPDWVALQDFVAQEMDRGRRLLLEAANAYEREVQDDPNKREARASVISEAYQLSVTTRQALEATIGETKALEVLGLVGPTPQRPQNLLERMREASLRLRDPERLPLDVRLPGMTQNWADLADALDEKADELEAVLVQQRAEKRDAELALVAKERALESFNNTYVGFTKLLDGLYIAADERELASRLRLSLPAANSGGGEALPEDVPGDGPGNGPPVIPGPPGSPEAEEEVLSLEAVALPPGTLKN